MEVARLYPNEGDYDVFRRQIHLPYGHRDWDVLVIDQAYVSGFPETLAAPVDHVGKYELFLRDSSR